jgi:hypothetical protein
MIYAIIYVAIGIVIAVVVSLYIQRLRVKLPHVFPEVDFFDFTLVAILWPWALFVLYMDRKEYKV